MFRSFAFALGVSMIAPAAVLAQDATTPTPPEATGVTTPAPAPAEAAPADVAAEAARMEPGAAYAAARNQLGILKHCQSQGFSGPEAVSAQERMISMMPAGDAALGDAAEAKGAEGTVAAMGAEITLAEGAANQNSTVKAQCQQIEQLVNEAAANLPAAG